MTVESNHEKVIIHNHGHAGHSWALGPALVAHTHDLWFKEQERINLLPGLDERITIVGAGLLAHLHAYDLVKKGFTNITLLASTFEHVIADDAGGLLRPVLTKNDMLLADIVNRHGNDAYHFYKEIAHGEHKDIHKGARVVPAYFESRAKSGLEAYVKDGLLSPAKSVNIDFGNGVQHRDMVVYDDSIFIDAPELLDALKGYLTSKNVQFTQTTVHQLQEIPGRWLIDVAGIGANATLDSEEKKLVQYQQFFLKQPDKISDTNYMLWVDLNDAEMTNEHGIKQRYSQAVYYFPKHYGLSGTQEMLVTGGFWVESPTRNTDEAIEKMIKNQERFFYGHQDSGRNPSTKRLLEWVHRLGV